MKNNNGYDFPIRDWKRSLFGAAMGLLTMLAASGGFAWLVHSEVMSREHMGLASAAVLVLGSFLGALSTGRGEGRILRYIAAGMGIALLLLAINLLLFDGVLKGVLPCSFVIAGGTAAAALLGGGSNRRSGRKYRYSKYRNR